MRPTKTAPAETLVQLAERVALYRWARLRNDTARQVLRSASLASIASQLSLRAVVECYIMEEEIIAEREEP